MQQSCNYIEFYGNAFSIDAFSYYFYWQFYIIKIFYFYVGKPHLYFEKMSGGFKAKLIIIWYFHLIVSRETFMPLSLIELEKTGLRKNNK